MTAVGKSVCSSHPAFAASRRKESVKQFLLHLLHGGVTPQHRGVSRSNESGILEQLQAVRDFVEWGAKSSGVERLRTKELLRGGRGPPTGGKPRPLSTTSDHNNRRHRLMVSPTELAHLFVTASGETVPFLSLSIFPNASRTNPSLSPLNRGLVASISACHGATPLASPPPPPARRGPPSVSRWVNKARISAVVNPALDEANAAFKSPKDRNPSLFLVGEKGMGGGTICWAACAGTRPSLHRAAACCRRWCGSFAVRRM